MAVNVVPWTVSKEGLTYSVWPPGAARWDAYVVISKRKNGLVLLGRLQVSDPKDGWFPDRTSAAASDVKFFREYPGSDLRLCELQGKSEAHWATRPIEGYHLSEAEFVKVVRRALREKV